jgi:hypothetical protein
MSDTEKQNSKFQHVYAIVRIDFPLDLDNPENTIAVVKVHSSKSDAESEVSRLKEINQEKGCNYTVYTTRLVP